MYGNPYYEPYQDDNELEHFGVLGMKWGVRRYQNKDGTLTAAGKQRAKKERTPEEQEKHDRRVATAKKAAKTAALVGAGALSMAVLASPTGERLISSGAMAISSILRVKDGPTYYNLQSIDAQKLQQVLRGESDGTTFRNLQSIAAQKLQQDIRRRS